MKKKNTPKFVSEKTFKKFARSVDNRFEFVDQRFDLVDQRFDRLENKVDGLETKVNVLAATVDRIAVTVVGHTADIQDIRATMMTRDMGQEILKQLGDFSARYEESERAARIHLIN